MKGVKYVVLVFLLACQVTFGQETITKNGKVYKVHKVESGQTLYSISRIYNVTPDEIKKANENTSTLSIGQSLYIPTNIKPAPATNSTAATTTTTSSKPSPKTHIVEGGETLFRIAQKYGISVDDVKAWNGLTSNGLSVGQKLLVAKPGNAADTRPQPNEKTLADQDYETVVHTIEEGETLYAIAAKYETTVTQIRKDNPSLSDKGLQIGATIDIVKRPANQQYLQHLTEPKKAVVPESPYHDYEKIVEKGTISITTESKYESKFAYCLHKTAEVGTLVKIINSQNGVHVWARVMGHIPATDSSILKVNKTVYNGIKANGSSTKGEISYRP